MPRPLLSTLLVLGALIAGLQTGCSSDPPAASEPSPAVPSSTDARLTSARSQLDRELLDAAWRNDVKRAQALIRDGADVNAKDPGEHSAFLIAASEGFLDLLELSLDSGADVASLDSYGGTALIRAAERGHADIVGRLLQTKINVDHVNRLGWTALHEAIWLGKDTTSYLDTVRLLVAGGADLKIAARTDGRTPLVMAQQTRFRDHRNHDSFGAGFTHRRWELGTPGRGQRREC
jgi:hypothetical protein